MKKTVGALGIFWGLVLAAGRFPLDSAWNLKRFELSASAREHLLRDGFVVLPDCYEQLFELYEWNWWDSVPSFVTSDLMLQLYHLFYENALARIEGDQLYFRLAEFTAKMWDKLAEYGDHSAKYLLRAKAFFGVACKLLRIEVDMPAEIARLCEKELALIDAHSGRYRSAIFPFMLDYSQFTPRSHYTRSDRLQRYFKAMMWFGLVPFPLEDFSLNQEDVFSLTRSAGLITLQMTDSDSLIRLWRDIYELTSFFVGKSEAYTPEEYASALSLVSEGERDRGEWKLSSAEGQDEFRKAVKRLRQPAIRQVALGIPTGLQFRLFGQRYVPDSDIMQALVEWPIRRFPKGLDVFAGLGSRRAREILTEVYREQETWKDYIPMLDSVTRRFARTDSEFWYQNFYNAWLYMLLALNNPVSEKAPGFMKGRAWQDKSLNTALGSWSELRHDAILYATSVCAECGDGGEMVKGYVEPNPDFFRRMLRLIELVQRKLEEKQVISAWLEPRAERLKEMIRGLLTISEKELAGVPLTEDEWSDIWSIGERIEGFSCDLVGDDIYKWAMVREPLRFMACIADVATSEEECLEVGVAGGNTILVLLPIEGRWTLAQGAVFSYREFTYPVSDRLTDEKWQELVRKGKAPPPPVWTKSFTAEP